jgi:hypothetical protein
MNVHLRAFASTIAVCSLLFSSSGAGAQTLTETVSASTVNGNPAIIVTLHVENNGNKQEYSSIVERGGTADEPKLLFHFVRMEHPCYGMMEVSAQHVRWSPDCEKHPFDFAPSEIQFPDTNADGFIFLAKGKKYNFEGGENDVHVGSKTNSSDMLRSLFQQSVQNFPQALLYFSRMRGDKPTVR